MASSRGPSHRLLSRKLDDMTGDCCLCGRVQIVRNGNQYKCLPGKRISNKRSWFRRVYGIELTYDEASSIKDSCDVCGRSDIRMCLDHDHKTNLVRGTLCTNCNMAIGYSMESIHNLNGMIEYLRKHDKK